MKPRISKIEKFAEKLREQGINVSTELFSDLQKTAKFRKTLVRFNKSQLIGNQIELREQGIRRRWYFSISNRMLKDTNINYTSDLRGVINLRIYNSQPDFYILGGDHRHNVIMGRGAFPSRIRMPLIVRAGRVYGIDGDEMHVSEGNTLPYSQMEKGPWLECIRAAPKYPDARVGPIDYYELLTPFQRWQAYSKLFKSG